ncbi:unnamed protein product, partial [Ectocarpus sp. 8 AP-2014]
LSSEEHSRRRGIISWCSILPPSSRAQRTRCYPRWGKLLLLPLDASVDASKASQEQLHVFFTYPTFRLGKPDPIPLKGTPTAAGGFSTNLRHGVMCLLLRLPAPTSDQHGSNAVKNCCVREPQLLEMLKAQIYAPQQQIMRRSSITTAASARGRPRPLTLYLNF